MRTFSRRKSVSLAGALSLWWIGGVLACGSGGSGTLDAGDGGFSPPDGGTDGGGLLLAGAACLYDAQCASQACGSRGYGFCCASPCDTRDPICGALACDPTGACVYPDAGESCAANRCQGAEVATSTCNGLGVCAVALAACPNHLSCALDAGSCPAGCASNGDCTSGYYCKGGECAPLQLTGPCSEDSACQSGLCLPGGTTDAGIVSDAGACCASRCDTADPACGATSCDSASGACHYPTDTAFCLSACSNAKITAGHCSGPAHTCAERTQQECPNFTVCQDATSCKPSCASDSDCDQTVYYDVGYSPPIPDPLYPNPNYCEPESHLCCPAIPNMRVRLNNGIVGFQSYALAGSTVYVDPVLGNDFGCCGQTAAAPCKTIDRAQALYPRALRTPLDNVLGPDPSSVVDDMTINVSINGGVGPQDWPTDGGWPLVIDMTSARLTVAGGTVFINPPDDWDGGPEGAAVRLSSHDQNPDGGDYLALTGFNIGIDSSYRQHANVGIGLDNGAFPLDGLPLADGGRLFNAPNVSLGSMWIDAAGTALRLGPGSSNQLGGPYLGNILIGSGSILQYPSFPAPNGADWGFNPLKASIVSHGQTGILCQGAAVSTVSQYQQGYVLAIDSQTSADIDAQDGCQLSFFGSVLLGWQPPQYGVGVCPNPKPDAIGIRASGTAQVLLNDDTYYSQNQSCSPCWPGFDCNQGGKQSLGNGYGPSSQFRCFSQFGVYQVATDAGVPRVEIDDALFTNVGCAGAYVAGGQFIVNNWFQDAGCTGLNYPFADGTAFNDDLVGIWIPADGGDVQMTQGPTTIATYGFWDVANPYNDFSCNTAAEPASCPAGLTPPAVGVGILNLNSSETVVAQDALWEQWDGTEPQYWLCDDATLAACVCQGPGCADAGAGPLPAGVNNGQGIEAVALRSNPTPFDFTGGQAVIEPLCR